MGNRVGDLSGDLAWEIRKFLGDDGKALYLSGGRQGDSQVFSKLWRSMEGVSFDNICLDGYRRSPKLIEECTSSRMVGFIC